MTRDELKVDIRDVADSIEGLEKQIAQLEVENAISSTTSSQREVNTFLIKRCNHFILMLEKKQRYLLLSLDQPHTEKHHLLDAINAPSSIRGYSPSRFLAV